MCSGSPFLEEGNGSPIDFDMPENGYYSYERFRNILSGTNEGDLTIIVVNISSLPLYIDDLTTSLRLLNFSPDIIGLSETRITDIVNTYYKPHLENYVYYPSTNSSLRAGSAGIFVKSSLVVTKRGDLDISVPGLFETVWVDVEHKFGGKK